LSSSPYSPGPQHQE
uniref:Uncharacterized protein n=1 Tax=Myotis lucifugus TaxID=59463 RepID=G1QCK5_MYOLU